MKPVVDLMDNSIKELSKLVPNEHQMKCDICGQIMDRRDLSQVFAHEDCNGIPKDYGIIEQIPHTGGQKNEILRNNWKFGISRKR